MKMGMPSDHQAERCTSHPQAEAGWLCAGCGKKLCPDCVADVSRVNSKAVACIHCGSIAEPLRIQRVVRSWPSMLPAFFKAILSPRALVQYLVISVIMCLGMLLGMLPFVGWILALIVMYGAWGTYLFSILRAGARGGEELPSLQEIGSSAGDLVATTFRLALATAIVWVPLVVYYWNHPFGTGYVVSGLVGQANWSVPIILAIQAFGLIYLPAAFILAAMADEVLDVLNPLAVFAVMGRVPGQYFAVAGLTVGFYIANKVLEFLLYLAFAGVVMTGRVGFVEAVGFMFVVQAVLMALPALIALVLGRFVYTNAEAFGLHVSARQSQAAMPMAAPRGRLPSPDQPLPSGMGGDPGSAAAVPEAPVAPVAVAPVALELESTPAEALIGALKSGHDGMVINAYRKMTAAGQTPQLDPERELELAKILDGGGDAMGAVHACRRAAQADMRGPLATRALFLAASLLIEKAGSPGDGQSLLKYLVDNYPGDPWAERAAQQLQG